jgi:hypothetical protein
VLQSHAEDGIVELRLDRVEEGLLWRGRDWYLRSAWMPTAKTENKTDRC